MQSLFSKGSNAAQKTKAKGNAVLAMSSDKENIIQDYILEGLAFASMKDRLEEVTAAHRKTFEWIFAAPESPTTPSASSGTSSSSPVHHSNFVKWLVDDSGRDRIYWINGKAGSGKSTLMRFIYDHERTIENLDSWAQPLSLTMAGFFFWTSGNYDQRSQVGLLRSLLYQLLQQHRDIIPVVFPLIWETACAATTQERIKTKLSWGLQELTGGLRALLKCVAAKTKICLWVDGLDEFDGDHVYIIKFFKDIVLENPDLKVCLSSRPWDVFEKAFQSSVPTLKLQDLTQSDMVQYVDDKLAKDPRVRRIVRKEPEEGVKLMADVVNKADGVFLWVTLAVRSLLEDLQAGDTVSVFQERLAQLPSDLDALFRHSLFVAQSQEQLIEASRIFQLVRAREIVCDFTRDQTASAMTLWELALAEAGDSDLALETEIHEVDSKELSESCNATKARLQQSCAGLLEVHNKNSSRTEGLRFSNEDDDSHNVLLASGKISYLHRTVRDFLIYQPGVWAEIEQQTARGHEPFEPHVNHLRSYILKLKLPLGEPERHRRLDEWWPDIISAMTHARQISASSINEQTTLLLEFDKTLSWYWVSRKSLPNDHWARSAFGSYEARNKSPIHAPFLALSAKFGLADFVALQSTAGDEEDGAAPLLSYAVEFLIHRRYTVYPLSSVLMVELLLKGGTDPNHGYRTFNGKDETPWVKALKLVREGARRNWIVTINGEEKEEEGIERWVEIMKTFVRYGADVNVVIPADRWDPEIDALGIIGEAVEKAKDRRIMDLRDFMIEHGAKVREKGVGKGEAETESALETMKIEDGEV